MASCWPGASRLALISLVTDMAPNFSRMMGALPVLIITAALGLDAGYRLIAPSAGATWAVAIVAAILAVGGASTGWDYFVRFARDPRASYQYDQDKIEAVSYLTAASVDHTVFLAELWAQHATIQLLTRDEDIRSLDTLSGIVFSAEEGRGALYAYPPSNKSVRKRCRGAGASGARSRPSTTARGRCCYICLPCRRRSCRRCARQSWPRCGRQRQLPRREASSPMAFGCGAGRPRLRLMLRASWP
jgi:hypothetical protein